MLPMPWTGLRPSRGILNNLTQGFPVDILPQVDGYGEVVVSLGDRYRWRLTIVVERVERLIGKGSVAFH